MPTRCQVYFYRHLSVIGDRKRRPGDHLIPLIAAYVIAERECPGASMHSEIIAGGPRERNCHGGHISICVSCDGRATGNCHTPAVRPAVEQNESIIRVVVVVAIRVDIYAERAAYARRDCVAVLVLSRSTTRKCRDGRYIGGLTARRFVLRHGYRAEHNR
jgi:hypothetical protein